MSAAWFHFQGEEQTPSPALVVYPERVRENVRRMIAIAGGSARLRPHIKTHKMPAVMRINLEAGLRRFKCATLPEAEMAAGCGAPDLLVAGQMTGPNVNRLLELQRRFLGTRFSSLVDDIEAARTLADAAVKAGLEAEVWLDLDCGQGRTGMEPGTAALEFYLRLGGIRGLRPVGLHAYDGHIHHKNLAERAAACEAAFAPVLDIRRRVGEATGTNPALIAGGTPTFPFHARRPDTECSPGTTVLWDAGYSTNLPDLDFLPAAALLARVISKPSRHRLCLDLGHKAVASEGPHPRVVFPEIPEATPVAHNEEHLVLETPFAANFPVGAILFGVPWHICPTVALYSRAFAVSGGKLESIWAIPARERYLSFEPGPTKAAA